MERGRKQFEEMVVNCSMHAATGKARSHRVDLCNGGTTCVVVVDDRIDDGVIPRRLSDECSLRGMPALIR